MNHLPVDRERVPSAPFLLNPNMFFAPPQVEELKREDVRFAAPFDPDAKMVEAAKQLFQPEPATARTR